MDPFLDFSRSWSETLLGRATSTDSDESQYQLRGYLKIQDEHTTWFGNRWKRRFVIMSEGCLNVYSNANSKNLRKSYPIHVFEKVTACKNNNTFMLMFRDASTPPIVCSCKSSLESTEWVRQIDSAISFQGDSAFESGEMFQHKTSDLKPTLMKDNDFRYSTVDERKLYKEKQNKTRMASSLRRSDLVDDSEDHTSLIKDNEELYYDCFEYSPTVDQSNAKQKTRQDARKGTAEDKRYHTTIIKEDQYYDCFENTPTVDQIKAEQKTKQDTRTGTAENPRVESKGNMTIGSEDIYVGKSSPDFKLDFPEIYRTEFQSFMKQKHSPSMIAVLGKPFMPEQYQTRETENVQVERLQTDRKGSWRQCFRHSRNFENDAKRLLLEGTLPDHSLFQIISKKYGRKSEIVRNISNGICQNIKEQSNKIVHVWPAYRHKHSIDYSEDQIVFVVITNRDANIQSDYLICQRHLNEISSVSENENKRIHDNEKLYDLRSDDLALYVKSKAKHLMEKHKKLTCVTVSVIKSSRHDMDDQRMVKLPCIALYVQIKGLIPIDEDPFQQFLDGYPVDVREGVFSLCGLPTDWHEHVRMGCAFDSGFGTKQGTVGPFFKFESDLHTYLLTSAHVLLDPEEMKKLIVDKKVYYRMFGTDTYQPPESISAAQYSRHHLGKLEFAVYSEGEQYKPGMEVALVRIDKQRVPIDGKFPNETKEDCILSLDDIGGYSKQLNDPYVYKYGAATGMTKGKLRFDGGSVRTGILDYDFLGMDLTLHGQIEIESVGGIPFGGPGDSGALVFRKNGDRLLVIGIFEGIIGHTYMVTPIHGIIEALSEFMSLFRDPPTDARMDFDEMTSNISIMLNHVPANNVPLSAGIDRNISAEISRQTYELQTNILHHTEHKFSSVKTELTAIKKHIDTTIDNSKREILESIHALAHTVNNKL